MQMSMLKNRTLFVIAVMLTGAVAGAFVWLFFFLMNKGLAFIWKTAPALIGGALPDGGEVALIAYPLAVCLIGGLVIGLYERRFGPYPEELDVVMKQVKEEGRYRYDDIGVSSVAALLPLLFGGSIGPEAGLTGAIAGLCTWVGDRMRRFGTDFKTLTSIGTSAALSAIFTAPLFGFAAPLYGSCDEDKSVTSIDIPKTSKIIIYLCAIAGALAAYLGLGELFGGTFGLPRFTDIHVGATELAWLVPITLVGAAGGWLYHAFNAGAGAAARALGDRPVVKAVIAGGVLACFGILLPFTMFAGETQAEELAGVWTGMGAFVLLATGFAKVLVTPLCIRMGWRGGHFFPVIFAGISIGYGMAALTGADPVFCLCASTAALVGGVMRQPVMAALLLFLCFPVKGIVVMLVAAAIGAAIPLPRAIAPAPSQPLMQRKKKADPERQPAA